MPTIDLTRYILLAFGLGVLFVIAKAIAQKFDVRPMAEEKKTSEENPAASDPPKIQPGTVKTTGVKSNRSKSIQGHKKYPAPEHAKPKKKAHLKNWWPGYKLAIEGSQFLATVCGAFVGLCATFMINAKKAEIDKKNHLLDVLGRYELANLRYDNWLQFIDSLNKVGFGDRVNKLFWKGIRDHDYPYFDNFKDPVLFETTPATIDAIARRDFQVRMLLALDTPGRTLAIYPQVMRHLRFSNLQISLEMEYVRCDIDSATLVDSTRNMVKELNMRPHFY